MLMQYRDAILIGANLNVRNSYTTNVCFTSTTFHHTSCLHFDSLQ